MSAKDLIESVANGESPRSVIEAKLDTSGRVQIAFDKAAGGIEVMMVPSDKALQFGVYSDSNKKPFKLSSSTLSKILDKDGIADWKAIYAMQIAIAKEVKKAADKFDAELAKIAKKF